MHGTIKVRMMRACNHWFDGDGQEVDADYARQLVGNGFVEEFKPKAMKPVPPEGRASSVRSARAVGLVGLRCE
jgi:hypothetical protein